MDTIRGGAPEGARRSGKIAKAGILGAVALLLAWMVVRTSAVDALLARNPAMAERLSPHDPQVNLALAMAELREGGAQRIRLTPDMTSRAEGAIRRAPLVDEPFLFGGLSLIMRGQPEAARTLLEEGIRRNPRSRPIRLFLLDSYLRTGRIAEAIREISMLSRLLPEANSVLVPELARYAQNPKTIGALERVLRTDPAQRLAIVNFLIREGAEPELVLRLAGADLIAAQTASSGWQAGLLDSMVKRGDVARAHALWFQFINQKTGPAAGIYNPEFQETRAPAPFNWTLGADGAGIAEPNANKGLDVTFYGRQNAVLATQMLVLRPGRYQLSMKVSGEAADKMGGLAWTLTCDSTTTPIVTLDISNAPYAGKRFATTFEVPSDNCAGQWLRLIGVSQEFPAAQQLTIDDLKLRSIGRL